MRMRWGAFAFIMSAALVGAISAHIWPPGPQTDGYERVAMLVGITLGWVMRSYIPRPKETQA